MRKLIVSSVVAQEYESLRLIRLNELSKSQLRICLPKFLPRTAFTALRIAVKAKPIIEDNDCSWLEECFAEIQHQHG